MGHNERVSTTEINVVLTADGKTEMTARKGSGVVATTEGNSEIGTTKGNGELLTTEKNEALPISGGRFLTALIVPICMAILLGVCLIALIYYWRKLKLADRSESVYAVKFEDRVSEYSEKADPWARSSGSLSLQTDCLLLNDTNASVNVEMTQQDCPETDIEETRL
jgi:hypothetical protein